MNRRILFNPTSVPALRTPRPPRPQTRAFGNVGNFARVGLKELKYDRLKGIKGVRRESTQIGENESGHITAGTNEGILFLDNLFPIKLGWLLRIPWYGRMDSGLPDILYRFNNKVFSKYDPLSLVERAIPSSVPLKVTEILPRLKEGGAFIKLLHDRSITAQEIEALISGYLKEKPIKPWFNPFRQMRAKLVRGKPWLEDLYRFPSTRIRVEFVPSTPGGEVAELSQEVIYSLFRKYGKIAEISSKPSDSKVLPKFAMLDFANIRHSIMARNCLHGLKVTEELGGGKSGTILRLSFETKMQAHHIREWLTSHPRVVIPAVAAILATVTVAVFDPIRTFFIKAHIDHAFSLKDNKIYAWFASQAKDVFSFRVHKAEEASLSAIWDDRKQAIEDLQTWLMETADTFIVVQGPRGSGKKELVIDQALKGRPNTLLIDCKPIQEARGDSATIAAAAATVGYRPVFSWMNSFSSLIDLAAQVALQNRKKDDKDANLADDDWLEAHPEHRPVVVIDNFLHKNEDSSIVYDKISEWAAGLTTSNIAHVIFLKNDISYSKSLSKALPDRVFRQIALGDITPQVAKKFVISHLENDPENPKDNTEKLSESQRREDLSELDECIEVLGGRLTDLEFLARRLKTGQTPKRAVAEIVEQSASEIMKMYLLSAEKGDRKWSVEQAWYLVNSLAENDTLRYNQVLLSDTFKSSLTSSASNGENVLEALSAAELITIKTFKGRPQSIKAGKPVYQAAFKMLSEDRVLRSRLDLAVLTELTKIETKSIDKYENELVMLGTLPKQPHEVGPRIQYLLDKLAASQRKVEAWEKEMGSLKKVLMVEY
ncbi:hypothetical protein BOTNAR_0228g00130 [Botryotinia narcissicola]|uniref:Mitochondrial escape protein 2 n=1 Tax=Botryotinia narcissicola TaxID=278944 RepID=A0A4Z1I4K8_9HELO|nr:hypothetical protein BOTNAR_0228g00130 [Botryotinia narcissicola]